MKDKNKKSYRKRTARKRLTERDVIWNRTSDIYRHQKDKAKAVGVLLDYTIERLRELVTNAVAQGHCNYCRCVLTVDNFSIDHMVPIARRGSHEEKNLLVCCSLCNSAKGVLDYVEFKNLLRAMESWSNEIRRHTLARLRAGGGRMRSAPRLVPNERTQR